MNNNSLTEGTILDKALKFALPLALTSMLQQIFNAADVAVVGRFASKYAMAAVGSNTPVVFLLINFFTGLSIGSNVVIARNIGAKRSDQVRKSVHTALAIALASGILIAIIGNLYAKPIIRLLAVPDDVADYSLLYLRIYFSGAPFIMLYNFGAAIFRSKGNTKTPLICLTIGGVLNVIANLFFVIVLKMDVDGVAYATVLANAVSTGLVLFFLTRDESDIRVSIRDIKFDRNALKLILKIGLPSGFQSMLFSVSNMVLQSGINSLGADVMAASSAGYNVEIFVFFVINAFSQTLVTFVGQNYGAHNYVRCRQCIRRITLTCFAATNLTCALLLIFLKPFLGLFTTEAAIVELACMRSRILLYAETLNMLVDNLSGAMRGLGRSLEPAIVVLVGVCGVRILWMLTGFRYFGTFKSIMYAYPISWIISTVVMVIIFYRTRKKMLPINEE